MVQVVNVLVGRQVAPDVLLHYVPMFQDVTAVVRPRVVRLPQEDVPLGSHVAPFAALHADVVVTADKTPGMPFDQSQLSGRELRDRGVFPASAFAQAASGNVDARKRSLFRNRFVDGSGSRELMSFDESSHGIARIYEFATPAFALAHVIGLAQRLVKRLQVMTGDVSHRLVLNPSLPGAGLTSKRGIPATAAFTFHAAIVAGQGR